jgi:hypothetical protein
MSDLVSKVLAGGISAGIFLFWWPAHLPAEGAEWLVLRGLIWSLAFEILLLSFCPLERAVTAAIRARRAREIAPRRLARALALAVAGLAVPAALVGGSDGELGGPAKAVATTQPKVIVKREVVRREVVVRRVNHVVRVPVATTTAPAAAAAPSSAPAAAVRRATSTPKPATAAKTGADVVATTPSEPTKSVPATTTATKAPAATAQPATTATPAPAATTAAPAAAAASTAAATPAPGH